MPQSTEQQIRPGKLLQTNAEVVVVCDEEIAFAYISGNSELSTWLTKCGPIAGAKNVEVIAGPYTKPGAIRKVVFEDGNSVTEELISYSPFSGYTYSVSHFSNFFRYLTAKVYAQLWFDKLDDTTRIKWVYSFTYKNVAAKIFISLFLPLFYKKFMQQALDTAKLQMEKTKPVSNAG